MGASPANSALAIGSSERSDSSRTKLERTEMGTKTFSGAAGVGVRLKSLLAELSWNTVTTVKLLKTVESAMARLASDDDRGKLENRATPSCTVAPGPTPSR